MGRIFVTGDTHRFIDIEKLDKECFSCQTGLTKDDHLIVCGDWGGIWFGDKRDLDALEYYDEKPFTTIVVLGNHENYDYIRSCLPETEYMGARCYKAGKSIYIIKRGEVITIDGKNFFCFGGAESIDKAYRQKGISWWAEELPSDEEMDHGLEMLKKHGNKIDYLITHDLDTRTIKDMFPFEVNQFNDYLSRIKIENTYKHHFAGHYHVDRVSPDEKTYILYKSVVEIEDDGRITTICRSGG